MPRYYDPTTGTEALEGIHDTTNATAEQDMPTEAREWFTRPARDGYRWQIDTTGKFPVEVAIPPPTIAELKTAERAWAQSELLATDPAMLPDSPYTDGEKTQIQVYRDALRNPAREATRSYPDPVFWRPEFPSGIKRPGE